MSLSTQASPACNLQVCKTAMQSEALETSQYAMVPEDLTTMLHASGYMHQAPSWVMTLWTHGTQQCSSS